MMRDPGPGPGAGGSRLAGYLRTCRSLPHLLCR